MGANQVEAVQEKPMRRPGLFKDVRWKHDIILIGNMAVLAACGLIYEYLLSQYAGRIIGAVETAIYSMIGIMIVSMGLGAFAAKWIKEPFRGFVFLELAIAILGGTSILIMSAIVSMAYETPAFLQSVYGVSHIQLDGGIVGLVKNSTYYLPFFFGFLIGSMIGMEIPLIARVREQIYKKHLEHNTGTIYGADYIGAGVGAALWVYFGLRMPIILAATYTAALNLLVACIFLYVYRKRISTVRSFSWFAGFVFVALSIVIINGETWMQRYNSSLFVDEVIYTKSTPYQQITLTHQHIANGVEPVLALYINGGLQFSENDEHIYHQMLVTPPMLASARHDKVLLIGGGDGLALRDILKWNPGEVTVVDLDIAMTDIFSGKDPLMSARLKNKIIEITGNSFADNRVTLVNDDAFLYVDKLIAAGHHYDVIIVDLPDPRHPNLNKLYSDLFYSRLFNLLSGDGAMTVQSTSPYHAKKAFISIGKSIAVAGFSVQQYHMNVPSFGEWGWSIGTKRGAPPLQRIKTSEKSIPVDYQWINQRLIESAFTFSERFFDLANTVEINHIGSSTVYHYYNDAWQRSNGIYMRDN